MESQPRNLQRETQLTSQLTKRQIGTPLYFKICERSLTKLLSKIGFFISFWHIINFDMAIEFFNNPFFFPKKEENMATVPTVFIIFSARQKWIRCDY